MAQTLARLSHQTPFEIAGLLFSVRIAQFPAVVPFSQLQEQDSGRQEVIKQLTSINTRSRRPYFWSNNAAFNCSLFKWIGVTDFPWMTQLSAIRSDINISTFSHVYTDHEIKLQGCVIINISQSDLVTLCDRKTVLELG